MATKLDLADAQFIGFHHGKWNSQDVIGLVVSMGLSKSEWNKWKANYSLTHLTEVERDEIDKYFKIGRKS